MLKCESSVAYLISVKIMSHTRGFQAYINSRNTKKQYNNKNNK